MYLQIASDCLDTLLPAAIAIINGKIIRTQTASYNPFILWFGKTKITTNKRVNRGKAFLIFIIQFILNNNNPVKNGNTTFIGAIQK